VFAVCLMGASAEARSPTEVRFLRNATSSFDTYLKRSTPNSRDWMRAHYAEMRGYAPSFTRNALRWAPPSEVYTNLYAIYPGDRDGSRRRDTDATIDREEIKAHPGWVLRDQAGRKLFIEFGCDLSAHRCPQYAANITNRKFRRRWIRQALHAVGTGRNEYAGIFIDDVNLVPTTTDAQPDELGLARRVQPRSPGRRKPLSDRRWRRAVARFTAQIARRLPNSVRITHNTYWRQLYTLGQKARDPAALRILRSADRVEAERGFNDAGLVGGSGPFGYATFASYLDWLHAKGIRVVLEPQTGTSAGGAFDGSLDSWAEATYELVNYLLVRDGQDVLAASWLADPPPAGGTWFPLWGLDLGPPNGPRYTWGAGLIRRDFGRVSVVLNPPVDGLPCSAGGAATQVGLPGLWRSLLTGAIRNTFTIGRCRGQILKRLP
jgi:Hypothetical glycosyl hydrolase family 15